MERALAIVPILVSIPYLISLGQGPKWEFIPMWDDVGNFIENDMIRDLGVSNLAAMWTEVRINVYEPLSWILKAFTVKMFGMSSFFVRLVTVCIHAANTTLVYSLTRRLVPSSCPTSSMVTALLWGLHPVQTEVICWPSAQPYALASFFALLSVKSYVDNDKYGEYAYVLSLSLLNPLIPTNSVRFTKNNNNNNNNSSVIFYICAVLSKSAAIFVPVCFVCLDFSRSTTPEFSSTLKTLIRRWTLERPHFYVCSALIALTMWANHHGMQLDADTYTLTQQERIGRIILSYSHSFLRVLWPVDLRPHYRLKIRDVQLDSSHVILASTVFLIFVLYVSCLDVGPQEHRFLSLSLSHTHTHTHTHTLIKVLHREMEETTCRYCNCSAVCSNIGTRIRYHQSWNGNDQC